MTAAEFLGHLADRGGWLSIAGGRLRYHGPAELATRAMREFVDAHREEIRTFLLKTEDEIGDEDLAALGYRRMAPGARILVDVAEFDGGWSPPADWGKEARDG